MTTDGSAVAEERTVPATVPDERPWRDRKRLLWLLGLVVLLLPLGGWEGFRATGAPVFLWMGPIWILVVIPVLDWVVGEDRSNAPESAMAQLEASRYYRWCTWLYLPLQFAGLVWATWIVSTTRLGWAGFLGWAFTVGAVGGIGIANAHELGHKRDDLERHSDHHANPTRRYQTLRHFDDAPQLPSGYGLMLGLAYMPPLWRTVMDKRVLALYGGDVTKANVQPSKRAKLLAKYR